MSRDIHFYAPGIRRFSTSEFAGEHRPIGRTNAHRAASGHGLHRIDHQILDDLADLTPVHRSRPQVRGQVVVALHGRAPQRKIG